MEKEMQKAKNLVKYCDSVYTTQRRKTRTVHCGDVPIGTTYLILHALLHTLLHTYSTWRRAHSYYLHTLLHTCFTTYHYCIHTLLHTLLHTYFTHWCCPHTLLHTCFTTYHYCVHTACVHFTYILCYIHHYTHALLHTTSAYILYYIHHYIHYVHGYFTHWYSNKTTTTYLLYLCTSSSSVKTAQFGTWCYILSTLLVLHTCARRRLV